jgi:glycosyltransferase involved in cell wall biosynthesis
LDKYKVAIVIPAYNEEDTIAEVIESVKEYGSVIVVNDASNDRTCEISERAGVIVVNHKKNKGYDSALNSGFIKAEKLDFDAVITFDADGQHDSNMLKEYVNNLRNGIDLVLGVRPKTARVSEWFFMLYTRTRFNWKDPLCGMKGYSMDLYRKQGYFDSYNSIGTELVNFGLLHNFSYVQLPVPISERKDNPRFYSLIRSNWYILKSLFKMVR